MDATLDKLLTYAEALARCADDTTRAEDRAIYMQHLAAVARMFVAALAGRRQELEELVATERRAFGWGYLSGAEGSAAERAFDVFAKATESTK